MSIQNQSDFKNAPRTVENIIHLIEERTVDDDYIFRGESQCHDKVSSNLYRELKSTIGLEYVDIEDFQDEILEQGKAYTDTTGKFEILTELQHYGGKTNLIDFTTDYKVALFFACYGSLGEPGRVIILRKTEKIKKILKYPRNPKKRVNAQKSVFVQPPKGYIERKRYLVICIPAPLKFLILQHLSEKHNITPKGIYNDIHGFISSYNNDWKSYRGFYNGLALQDSGDDARHPEEKQEAYEKAIEHYTYALGLEVEDAAVYNNRGNVYLNLGEIDNAIGDFNKAIELVPYYADPYYNRGTAYLDLNEIDKAIEDLNTAIVLPSVF